MNACPRCQNAVDTDALFCNGCGFKIEIVEVSTQVLQPTIATPVPAFCPSCGNSFNQGDKFCKFCANDLRSLLTNQIVEPPKAVMPMPQTSYGAYTPSDNNTFAFQTHQQEENVSETQTSSSGLSMFISPTGAGIAAVCFFLPWLEVSCNVVNTHSKYVSGADLTKADGSLWLLLFAALTIIGAFAVCKLQNRVWKSRIVILIISIIALGYMLIKAVAVQSELNRMPNFGGFNPVQIKPQIGLLGIIFGFIASLIGCAFLSKTSTATVKNYDVSFGKSETNWNAGSGEFWNAGVQPNVAALLCYIFILFPLIFFIAEPYNRQKFIRFHAIQALLFMGTTTAAYIVAAILWAVLLQSPLGVIFGLLYMTTPLAGFVAAIVCMVKAYQGEVFKLPKIGDLAMSKV